MRLQTTEAQEFRLQQIYTLDQKGYSQNEIAELTDCTQSWVSQILKRVAEQGVESLQAKESNTGKKAALGEEELFDLGEVLDAEARASGFETDGWTRKRVARVIFERYQVRHSRSHISRILAKIGFTRQKPQREDYRKDEKAVQMWYRRDLPELKKKL